MTDFCLSSLPWVCSQLGCVCFLSLTAERYSASSWCFFRARYHSNLLWLSAFFFPVLFACFSFYIVLGPIMIWFTLVGVLQVLVFWLCLRGFFSRAKLLVLKVTEDWVLSFEWYLPVAILSDLLYMQLFVFFHEILHASIIPLSNNLALAAMRSRAVGGSMRLWFLPACVTLRRRGRRRTS